MNLELKDKVVFITGASGGIGRALAEAFAAEGALLALTGNDAVESLRTWVKAQPRAKDMLAIACDTHPLNNLPITGYLRKELGADDAGVQRWIEHWIHRGFTGLERWVASLANTPTDPPHYCFGSQVTLADACLVPQMYNARRFKVDVNDYPNLVAISRHLEGLPAFAAARPEAQPDAE